MLRVFFQATLFGSFARNTQNGDSSWVMVGHSKRCEALQKQRSGLRCDHQHAHLSRAGRNHPSALAAWIPSPSNRHQPAGFCGAAFSGRGEGSIPNLARHPTSTTPSYCLPMVAPQVLPHRSAKTKTPHLLCGDGIRHVFGT